LRITVPFAAGILFTVTFFYHLSSGPMWNLTTDQAVIGFCKKYWWTSLLYISNYVNPERLCFGHSWYLLVDMQLYLLSPLILYPLWKFRNYRRLSIVFIFSLASVSIIYVSITVITDEIRTSIMFENKAIGDAKIYYQTFSRLDSWMIGILTGYIFHEIEGKVVKLSKKTVVAGWILSASAILGIIFGQYPLQQIYFNNNSIIADACYNAFKRIFWCLSLSWIIIANQISYGGFVNRFLSLSIWLPISKLSFCIYLLHLPIQTVYIGSIRQPEIISGLNTTYKFFGDFLTTFFVAFGWALVFEYPVLRVMKVYLDWRKEKISS
jgi:peptidoglycan/LPS O-acetylase OafA/YrhL